MFKMQPFWQEFIHKSDNDLGVCKNDWVLGRNQGRFEGGWVPF